MTKTWREFAPEFERETVPLLESSGRPLMQVATEIGIAVNAPLLAIGDLAWRVAIVGGDGGHPDAGVAGRSCC